MARKKSGGDGGSPVLIIFLVLFILSTITLGVLYWTSIETAKKGAKDSEDSKKAIKDATDAKELAEDKARLYRVFFGTASEDDRSALQNVPESRKAALQAEHQQIMTAANTAIDTTVANLNKDEAAEWSKLGVRFNLKAKELFSWDWPANGALPKQPAPGPLLDRLARVVAERERTFYESGIQRKNAYDQSLAYQAEKTKYTNALADLKKQTDEQIKKLDNAITAVETEKKEAIARLDGKSDEYRKSIAQRQKEVEEKEIQLKEEREKLLNVQRQLTVMLDRQNELEQDRRGAFAVNEPHGSIVSRSGGGKMVEIDIGSAAGLKPGQTFTVQPASTRTEGLGRKRKQSYNAEGRLVMSDELYSKGAIEVVEVLGPNLATARITDETDDIRDSILKGDLLYNPLFKKNAHDHVVLVGIFDIDADGIDDIATVARNLAKRGAIVDGYWDLSTGKWESLDPNNRKPGPGPNTTYVVRGWDADPPNGDPLLKARGELRTQINNALTEAKLKGAQEVKATKFLSEIGYSFSPSISDETVSAAMVKYIKDTPTTPAPK